MIRPLLLLDVDGVLNPFDATACPDGFTEDTIRGFRVRLSAAHGQWLRELHHHFEVVWATAWEDHAAQEIAPRLGLPDWPHLTFDRNSAARTWKLPDITAYVGDRPAIWIDDDLHSDAYDWAACGERMLLCTDPAIGMTREHVDCARRWALMRMLWEVA